MMIGPAPMMRMEWRSVRLGMAGLREWGMGNGGWAGAPTTSGELRGHPTSGHKAVRQPRDYRDLRVWTASIDLAVRVYAITASFPRAELFVMTSQMRRAALSVASNTAEGNARTSTGEFLRFLSVARASLAEPDTQFVIAGRLCHASGDVVDAARSAINVNARMLKRLEQVLHRRLETFDGEANHS